MKIKLSTILAVTLLLALVLTMFTACNNDENFLEGKVIVTYVFNGGTLNRGTNKTKVTDRIYYGFEPGSYIWDIVAPKDSSQTSYLLEKDGYVFDGWYKDKECTQPWDFANERVNQDITLYAKWREAIIYRYVLCLVVDGDEKEVISFSVQQGDKFDGGDRYSRLGRYDECNGALKGYSKTLRAYYSDKDLTTEWDPEFTHPGGETSTDIKIYADTVDGNNWRFVKDYDTLKKALEGSENIYLEDDVDCNGEEVPFTRLGVFNRTLQGNGHAISNFAVGKASTSSDLYPSFAILGKLGSNAKVLNVRFVDVQFTLTDTSFTESLKLAALAFDVERDKNNVQGAEVHDVTISGTYINELTKLKLTDAEIEQMLSVAIYGQFDQSKVTGFSSAFTRAQ